MGTCCRHSMDMMRDHYMSTWFEQTTSVTCDHFMIAWFTNYKLSTLVFRCLHGLAPRYLSDLCTPATVHTHLRSSVTLERSLLVPGTKTKTIGPRGFYFASSAAWNALPVHLRDPGLSLNNFKIKLKTHFFSWRTPPGIMFSVFVARQRDNL